MRSSLSLRGPPVITFVAPRDDRFGSSTGLVAGRRDVLAWVRADATVDLWLLLAPYACHRCRPTGPGAAKRFLWIRSTGLVQPAGGRLALRRNRDLDVDLLLQASPLLDTSSPPGRGGPARGFGVMRTDCVVDRMGRPWLRTHSNSDAWGPREYGPRATQPCSRHS